MGFNSGFKGLKINIVLSLRGNLYSPKYLFKTHLRGKRRKKKKKKEAGLCSIYTIYTQCVSILILQTMINCENQQLCCVTGISSTILSGAVFKYISYNVMQNVLLLHTSILTHPIRKERGKYIQGVPGGMCQTSGGCSLC